jgi:UDP-2,3-diacylglucosamine hydrolase
VKWIERFLTALFSSKVLKVPFIAIHPYWTMAFGVWWSKHNRKKHGWADKFYGIDKEYLAIYARKQLKRKHFDFFIFGHRHLAMDMALGATSRYINTGEWVQGDTYADFDGENLCLHSFQGNTKWLLING